VWFRSHPVGEALARYLRARADHPQAGLEWMWLGKRGRFGESGVAQILARRGVEAGLGRSWPLKQVPVGVGGGSDLGVPPTLLDDLGMVACADSSAVWVWRR
jgi:hypothetical protein